MNAAKFTSRHLDADLRKKKIERIYLFTGDEDGEKEKFAGRIIGMMFSSAEDAANSTGRFRVENDEFGSACDFAMTQSMFSERKACIIHNIDGINGKNNIDLLNELILQIPDSNLLFLMTPENHPPRFISAEALKKVKVVQFWRYFENDLFPYIINSLKKNGIEIERKAAGLLIELLGSDIRKIDGAIEKISYSGEKNITPDMVESFVQFEKDVNVFDFIDAVFKKDKNAVNLLARILENGVYELSILSLIFRQAELIEKYYGLLNDGVTREEAAHSIGIFPKNRAGFLEHTRKFSPADVKRIFPLIHRADYRIKSARYSNNLVENPIFELVAELIM